MRLRSLAPAKVNLALFLGGVRSDGRHRLATVFESLSLADELILSTLGPDQSAQDMVVCPGVSSPELASQALAALRDRGWDGPAVRIDITKRIPIAAGMAGGSADAAAALRLAMELAPGHPEALVRVAASLGADVPAALVPGVSLGTGAGELVESCAPLAEHAFVVVPQPFALSTAEVYREADRLGLGRSAAELDELESRLIQALRPGARLPPELLVNDLAPAAVSLAPTLPGVLEEVEGTGAEAALICGSGPTVAGVFWGAGGEDRAREVAERLGRRYPGACAAVPVTPGFGIPSPL
ncbi:MAG: 4-(cytidine 5'-diphospho)-2-C-methyl-D-erythritol kinase [Solirubrobacteraceae bacterium]